MPTGIGHVSRGAPALVRPLSPTVTLTKVSVGPMDNNAYLMRHRSGAQLLVDAANDVDRLLRLIDGRLDAIVTTHRHADHWQALAAVAGDTGAPTIGGTPDAAAIAAGAGVHVDAVWTADRLTLGDESLEVIGLVGHTPGSIALLYEGPDRAHLLTGDSLFPGGPGKTRSATDFASLMGDLESRVFGRFDDTAVIYPGHGDDSTLGHERPQLAAWRARGW